MADNAIWLQYKVLDNKAPLFCTRVSAAASAIAPRVTQQHKNLTKKGKICRIRNIQIDKECCPVNTTHPQITQTLFRQVNDSQLH